MKTKERIEYIDFFRGVGIILMVMGHMAFGGLQGFGDLVEKYIHSFHMPMFFIISGYFYQKKANWISFVKGKMRTIMLPYIAFGGGYSMPDTYVWEKKVKYKKLYHAWFGKVI